MSETKPAATPPWLQLAQPFASLAAVVLGLLFLKLVFNIEIKKINLDFGTVSAEVTQTLATTQDNVSSAGKAAGQKLDELARRIALLEARLAATSEPATTMAVPAQPAPSKVPDVDSNVLRTATDLAPLFQKQANRRSPLFDREGFIFIGNAKDGAIDASNLRAGSDTVRRLADLKPGSPYTTSAHLTLRGSFPGDNKDDYYLGIPSLGVVTSGLSVILLEPPREAVRPSGLVQLWARVRVAE